MRYGPPSPWEKIATDIFSPDGKDYQVTIDYYSNFWEVDRLPNTKASTTILKLKSHFARDDIPDQVISDNGPQFASDEFADFAKLWDFEHLTSSPGNSKVNGKTKSVVKTAKHMLKKAIRAGTDPYPAILENSVHTHTRNDNQSSTTSDEPEDQDTPSYHSEPPTAQRYKCYDRSAKDLPSLSKGDAVKMKPFKLGNKFWRKAQVTARLDERSYTVQTDDGAVYCTKRQHLRKTSEPPAEPSITEREADMTSVRDEMATTTVTRPCHPGEVTVPEQCRRS